MWFSPSTLRHLVGVTVSAAVVSPALATISDKDYAPDDIITRDVCVLGGGATGAYAAVRLKDKAQSVVVVERNVLLGGHTETLYVGDDYVDYGVEGVFNTELSQDFFERLGVDHKPLLPNTLIDKAVNFRTGEEVDPPAGLLDTVGAALLYRGAIQKYHYFDKGVYNISDPVPDELLRPFGNSWRGNTSKLFGKPHLDAFLKGGYITPKNGMYQLYERASQVLGSDVLYQSTVNETERSSSGVKLVVQSTNGTRKLIKAKKLLVTFAPTTDNLNGFDLSENESSLFQKWTWNTYYVGVVNNTGLPNSTTVTNVDPETGPGGLPKVPFQWALQYLGAPGYLATKIVADKDFSTEQAKALFLDDIRRMGTAGTYSVKDPEIVAFGSHAPEGLTVTNDEIRHGFYQKLYGLQGNENTYYTGLAWCSDYTALLWAYTDTVLKQMMSA